MAKNKRKISKKSVKKIQDNKSLNKAIHLLFLFSYAKQQHQGSQSDSSIPKSKQKSITATIVSATRTFIASTTAQSRFLDGSTRTRRLLDLSYLIFERTTIGVTLGSTIGMTIRTTIGTNIGPKRLINDVPKERLLNRVSNMNSKKKIKIKIKISFKLAKNKRKISKHPVKKNTKNYISKQSHPLSFTFISSDGLDNIRI